ncbi:hypothetical protein GCM10009415_30920 [Chitinophaga japonensis]
MQQGLIPGDDTVYLISYDADNRVKSIIDSAYDNTWKPVYDNAGNLISITESGWNISFSYNADNQLTQIDYQAGGIPARYTFEYVNGVVSKKSYYTYTDLQVPELRLWRYFTYEVTDGNITGMKQYDSGDNLVNERKFTYNGEPNVFKPISLFNFLNNLGTNDIANFETFFNKNLITSTSIINNGQAPYVATYAYTYNDNKQLTKIVVSWPSDTFTWQLSY